jgi:hypothetical protein
MTGSYPGNVYWMDVSDLLAITLKKKLKIKVAKWETPKKYFTKMSTFLSNILVTSQTINLFCHQFFLNRYYVGT